MESRRQYCHQFLLAAATAVLTTDRATAAHRNRTADDSWYTARDCYWYLTRNTSRSSHCTALTHLSTDRIRYFAGARLFHHATGCTRNSPCDTLSDDAAFCVRNLFADLVTSPCTGGVRNLSCTRLFGHRTGRVRNLSSTLFSDKRTCRIRNLSCACLRYVTANRIRNFPVTNFRDHPRALNRFLDDLRAPDPAAHRPPWTLNFTRRSTTGIARIRDTLTADRSGNMLNHCLPLAAADIHTAGLGHRLHDRIAHIFPASLSFQPARRVTLFAVAGLVDRFADVVALRAITGLVTRLADCVTDVFVACLVAGLPDVAGHGTVARLIDWSADLCLNTFVLGFVYRPADCVTFVAPARLIDVADIMYRHAFRALVVDCFHTGPLLRFHHDFRDRAVLGAAGRFRSSEIAAVITGRRGTARKAVSPAQSGYQ